MTGETAMVSGRHGETNGVAAGGKRAVERVIVTTCLKGRHGKRRGTAATETKHAEMTGVKAKTAGTNGQRQVQEGKTTRKTRKNNVVTNGQGTTEISETPNRERAPVREIDLKKTLKITSRTTDVATGGPSRKSDTGKLRGRAGVVTPNEISAMRRRIGKGEKIAAAHGRGERMSNVVLTSAKGVRRMSTVCTVGVRRMSTVYTGMGILNLLEVTEKPLTGIRIKEAKEVTARVHPEVKAGVQQGVKGI